MKILIVDDEISIRRGLSIALEMVGRSVETACDGVDGLEKATQSSYDLIIADIAMPRMNGLELTRNLRENKIDAPIILCSAHFTDEAKSLAKEDPDISLLEKPMSLQEIRSTVESLVQA